jgi:16S rRNA processing protein RimM
VSAQPPSSAADPEASGSLAVGVVTGTHGVAGELRLKSLSGESGHLLKIHEALFRKGRIEKRLRLASMKAQPGGAIMKVVDIDTPEQAKRLVGFEMWVPRSQASPLLAGEFYAADLCRCTLWFGEEEIGRVESVWDGGPSQLLEVRGVTGRTYLVPFSAHFIGAVELEKGRISLLEDEIVR